MFNKQGDERRVTHSNIRGLSGGQRVRGWGGKKELMERGAGTRVLILRNKKQGDEGHVTHSNNPRPVGRAEGEGRTGTRGVLWALSPKIISAH